MAGTIFDLPLDCDFWVFGFRLLFHPAAGVVGPVACVIIICLYTLPRLHLHRWRFVRG